MNNIDKVYEISNQTDEFLAQVNTMKLAGKADNLLFTK